MMNIRRYTPEDSAIWDNLVDCARNATFLFKRQYMDYHSHRFADHSLVIENDRKQCMALLPANETQCEDGTQALISHQGLTYGGLIMHRTMHATQTQQAVQLILDYLKQHNFKKLIYKPLPYIYQQQPSDDDTYWMWRQGAKTAACALSTTINLTQNFAINKRKQTYCNKLKANGYKIDTNADIRLFWPVLTENLMRTHNVMPVHTIDEMMMLKKRFPENIICQTVISPQGKTIAGTLLYITGQTVHTQYLSASEEGKQCNAMDYLIISLIKQLTEKKTHTYIDFGISTEQAGKLLNNTLCQQKEAYGGRSTIYNVLEINI